ncbi:YdjC-like protein [Lacibacter cauensis]|uniref:YdjC-like protein n=1 Tax=Lacibacter cauensis TaxID=510947 RepID=A0A562SE83_9BACT|nr:ChbG/HpnK family deacetylase [Lacibacter cauensis]TWI79086.1 YdjC-like protein [Lacibacter cauensis]
MKVHLHADDAGIGESATQLILDGWARRIIGGFGIVSNKACMSQISEALNRYQELPCTISAHLNLTDGFALLKYENGSTIMDKDGRLKTSFLEALFILLKGGSIKQRFLEEVYQEWDLQIAYLKHVCQGRDVDVINGHNHMHMLPSLFNIAVSLADKHNIKYIRVVDERLFLANLSDMFMPFFWINLCKWVVLKLCLRRIKKQQHSYKAFTQKVFGVLYSGHMTTSAIKKYFSKLRNDGVKSLEVIVHPGLSLSKEMDKWASRSSAKRFFISKERIKEMSTLNQLQSENVFSNYNSGS